MQTEARDDNCIDLIRQFTEYVLILVYLGMDDPLVIKRRVIEILDSTRVAYLEGITKRVNLGTNLDHS
jgi:hypothetical protein